MSFTTAMIIVVIAHLLLFAAGISLIVIVCVELWEREQAKQAAELAAAMERHPSGSALKERN